jgi:hypothetical protein
MGRAEGKKGRLRVAPLLGPALQEQRAAIDSGCVLRAAGKTRPDLRLGVEY